MSADELMIYWSYATCATPIQAARTLAGSPFFLDASEGFSPYSDRGRRTYPVYATSQYAIRSASAAAFRFARATDLQALAERVSRLKAKGGAIGNFEISSLSELGIEGCEESEANLVLLDWTVQDVPTNKAVRHTGIAFIHSDSSGWLPWVDTFESFAKSISSGQDVLWRILKSVETKTKQDSYRLALMAKYTFWDEWYPWWLYGFRIDFDERYRISLFTPDRPKAARLHYHYLNTELFTAFIKQELFSQVELNQMWRDACISDTFPSGETASIFEGSLLLSSQIQLRKELVEEWGKDTKRTILTPLRNKVDLNAVFGLTVNPSGSRSPRRIGATPDEAFRTFKNWVR
ncbi:MAG: hypothetical protein KDB07_08210 [Planctomycetes bacterium]|nr:hypothetical protein [Planctomycetota bacterium]